MVVSLKFDGGKVVVSLRVEAGNVVVSLRVETGNVVVSLRVEAGNVVVSVCRRVYGSVWVRTNVDGDCVVVCVSVEAWNNALEPV